MGSVGIDAGTANTNGHASSYKYPQRYLGEKRPIRIVVVGAGVTGIAAAKLYRDWFPERDVEFVIYEKNADITGTWLENRYPGCACDVPAHAYTYSWEGNPRWSRVYVGAVELHDYFKGLAGKYGISEFLKLNHRIDSATWNDKRGKWALDISDLHAGVTVKDEAELIINGAGFLKWDDTYDFKDKTVAVIGSGSSAIQIVPKLQPEFAPEGRAALFSEMQKHNWETNTDEFQQYRKAVESTMNSFFPMQFKNSDVQKMAFENFRKTMKERLSNREDLIAKLVPDFEVGCRRITPGHGYLEALSSHNVTVTTESIARATSKGLRMADGSIVAVDAIICATGFDTSYRPNFPLIAFDKDLRDLWHEEPKGYFSITAAGIPNYFIMSGPNFPLANGCLIPCLETNIKFAFAAAKKIQYDGIKWLSPKQAAVDDYQEYKDSIMEDLVWTGSCASWYKNGKRDGKVWGPYGGSSLHYLEVMSQPRWEDFDIEYMSRNRYDFLGNGSTQRELQGGDLAYYVR
ncbi:hypothetical protein LTS10_000255 [Elasticomyces elasticus]|nr:hypothetical protein LTS10_000255 [Elasticomyces elasticus]